MKDLTLGNERKLIFYFAVPMLLGNAFQIFSSIVDSYIVGNYIGKTAIAAIGASFPVIFALISLIIGMTSAITVIIAQYYGARDFAAVKRAIDTSYIFLFFSSIVISILGILFCDRIFMLMGLPPDVLSEAVKYMHVYLLGIVFMAAFVGTTAILRGLGDSKTPLYFLIISVVISVLLELLFILVLNIGIRGAALATVCSQIIAFIIATVYLNKTHKHINIGFKKLEFDKFIFSKAVKIGLPSGLQSTFVSFGMIALMKIVSSFGTDTIAAYTIAGRIDSFASLPAMNFSMALSAFVGQNLGAGKPERVRNGLRSTWVMSGIISVAVTVIVLLFAENLIGLFNQDPKVMQIGEDYLFIVCSFYIFFSTMFVNNGLFRGAGDTLIPMFITLFSLWLVRIPVAIFLSARMGPKGIWWSIPIAWAIGLIFSFIYYKTGRWKKKVITKSKPIDISIEEAL